MQQGRHNVTELEIEQGYNCEYPSLLLHTFFYVL